MYGKILNQSAVGMVRAKVNIVGVGGGRECIKFKDQDKYK